MERRATDRQWQRTGALSGGARSHDHAAGIVAGDHDLASRSLSAPRHARRRPGAGPPRYCAAADPDRSTRRPEGASQDPATNDRRARLGRRAPGGSWRSAARLGRGHREGAGRNAAVHRVAGRRWARAGCIGCGSPSTSESPFVDNDDPAARRPSAQPMRTVIVRSSCGSRPSNSRIGTTLPGRASSSGAPPHERSRGQDRRAWTAFPARAVRSDPSLTGSRVSGQGIIPRVGLVVVWGPPKCGKSFWAFDLVMHVALGWEYRGRRVQQGPVVYLALEGGEGFRARIEAFRQSFLPEVPEPVPFYLGRRRPQHGPKDHGDPDRLHPKLQAAGRLPAVVVIDTLNRSLAGSESDDKDMAAYIRAADAIRAAFGCVVIVVHHCGIDATRPRGHTSLSRRGRCPDRRQARTRSAITSWSPSSLHEGYGPEGDSPAKPARGGRRRAPMPTATWNHVSCSVIPDRRRPRPRPRATEGNRSAKKVALDILRKALDEAGSIPPSSNHIPPNTRTIPVETWRAYAYQASITESDKPDARQKAFVRAVRDLQAADLIGIWRELVWLI